MHLLDVLFYSFVFKKTWDVFIEKGDSWSEGSRETDKGENDSEKPEQELKQGAEYRQHKAVTYNKVTEFKARPGLLVFSWLLSCARTHTHTHTHTHTRTHTHTHTHKG